MSSPSSLLCSYCVIRVLQYEDLQDSEAELFDAVEFWYGGSQAQVNLLVLLQKSGTCSQSGDLFTWKCVTVCSLKNCGSGSIDLVEIECVETAMHS